jgi:hypothetical protein
MQLIHLGIYDRMTIRTVVQVSICVFHICSTQKLSVLCLSGDFK